MLAPPSGQNKGFRKFKGTVSSMLAQSIDRSVTSWDPGFVPAIDNSR